MQTIKNSQKVITQLRKQLMSLQNKQTSIRRQLREALQKAGKNAGKSVYAILQTRKKS